MKRIVVIFMLLLGIGIFAESGFRPNELALGIEPEYQYG